MAETSTSPVPDYWGRAYTAEGITVYYHKRRCPTGALHYVLQAGPPEQPEPTTIDVRQGGPNFLRGDLTIAAPESADPAGTVRDTRATLCRCGQSGNKPFCDGTHREVGFQAPGGEKLNDA